MMEKILVLSLVFAAVLALGYAVLGTLCAALFERVEAQRDESGNLPPLQRIITPLRLMKQRVACGFSCAAALLVILVGAGVLNPLVYLPVSTLAGVAGFMLPLGWHGRKVRQRAEAFEDKILDMTVGLSNGLRSGQALPAALESVSTRVAGPMAEELATVLREYRLGLDLPDALARLNARMPCEDLQLLVGSIRLTMQSGGSLADVLERIVEMIRGRREFQEKLKTMTAQGRFEAVAMSLAPAFVFALLYAINKPLMLPLVTTGMGWCAISGSVLLVTAGYFTIKKIVTIEV
ncbi:MAG: type II secretion system F family protein [Kiritimatiellaeota bacterium]|nr:type II secretion system F family protein [Kiritimatiellota bacterium]